MARLGIASNRWVTRRMAGGIVLVASLALSTGGMGAAGAKAQAASRSVRFTSAEECARCHVDIHRYWEASMHAQAA